MLAKQMPEGDPKQAIIEKIVKQTFRASEIVNNLLNFSRTGAAEVVDAELAEMGDGGKLAVIAPATRILELAQAIPAAIPGDRPQVLDSAVALLTVNQAKGLEFDRVVLVDPAGLLAQSPVGGHDLYVAITRATHRLTVVYDGELPASLHRLAS